jgi:exodeoxyribonuclease VII large subunit
MRLRQVRPKQFLKQRRELLQATQKRLRELARVQFKNCKISLAATESRLRLLGPEQVLSRGYSITMDAATGKIIRRAKDAKPGQRLNTRVKEGEIRSTVEL